MLIRSSFALFVCSIALGFSTACETPIACEDNSDCPTDRVCRDNVCGVPSTAEPAPEGNPEPTPEGTPEGTPEPTPEPTPTPEGTPEPTPEGTPEPSSEPESACSSPPCFHMIDSATAVCEDEDGFTADPCPAEGDPAFGQDGNTVSPAPDYTFTAGNNIRDELNDLVWEIGQTTGLDHQQAVDHCAQLGTEGLTWRLPTIRELYTLLDLGSTPNLNPGFNPPADSAYHSKSSRTQTTWYAVNLESAFQNGAFVSADDEAAVKCVSGEDRGGADFVRTGAPADQIATDVQTGITLQLVPNSADYWTDALSFCLDLELGGFDDWHLATAKELILLVDPPVVDNAKKVHPFFTDNPQTIWSSSAVRRPAIVHIFWFDQDNGSFGQSSVSSGYNAFRCARGP